MTEPRASFSQSNFRTQTHTHTARQDAGFPRAATQDSKGWKCPEQLLPAVCNADTLGVVPFATAKSVTAEAKKML